MMNAIYERRSIRKFSNRNVPKELILEIIDAARLAPSAKNRQPWKYIIFAGEPTRTLYEQSITAINRRSCYKKRCSPIFGGHRFLHILCYFKKFSKTP